jgi:hypothetical protein
MLLRRSVLCLAAFVAAPAVLVACPFCGMSGQTMMKEVDQAAFVVYGLLANPQIKFNADGTETGTTDLHVEAVIKTHDILKDKKMVVLPKYVPVEPQSKVRFIIFCGYFRDRIDPYRGMPVPNKELVAYMQDTLKVKDKPLPERLLTFFKYLGHDELEISVDAFKEFGNADAKEVMEMLKIADKDAIRKSLTAWLRDSETPPYRYGLYGYLLGLCRGSGKEKEDAGVLLELLNDKERGLVSGVDGVLAGLIMLQPKEGWDYLLGILSKPKEDFTRRMAAIRAARFFWEYPEEKVGKEQVIAGLTKVFDHPDLCDLVVEDLRVWKRWEHSKRIFSLLEREEFDVPIVKNALIRYALSCPKEVAGAKEFLDEMRKKDASRVKRVEDLLRSEEPKP